METDPKKINEKLRKLTSNLKTLMEMISKEEAEKIRKDLEELKKRNGRS